MTRLDWMAVLLAISLLGAFLVAVAWYLRTAYRTGGWPEVRASSIVAIIALLAFYIVRTAQNEELRLFKDAIRRLTR